MLLGRPAQTGTGRGTRPGARRSVPADLAAGALAATGLLLVGLLLGVAVGQVRLAHVTSGSMGDAAPTGSLVVGRQVPLHAVRTGDVLTFTAPSGGGQLVTHRVASVTGTAGDPVLQTRGDRNASADPWLLDRSAGPVWRSALVVPRAGLVLASPSRLLALALSVVPLVVAVLFLRALWRPPVRRASA